MPFSLGNFSLGTFTNDEFKIDAFQIDVQQQIRQECQETGLSKVGKISARDGGFYDVDLPDGKTLKHLGVNVRQAFSIGDYVGIDNPSGMWVIVGPSAEAF